MSTRYLTGDCRELLPALPAESVHCVVTSPPYWGLRDYGTATWKGGNPECEHIERQPGRGASTLTSAGIGQTDQGAAYLAQKRQYRDACRKCGARRIDSQIGLEPTYTEYVETMVAVFREVRRVLRKDGTLWLNLGSSYAGGGRGEGGSFTSERRGYDGMNAIQSRQPEHGPAYDSDGIGQPDWQGLGSFCSGLCDECLDDFLSRHGCTPRSGQPPSPSEPQPLPTGRDSGRSDFEPMPLHVLQPDVPLSTTIEFWRRLRGACSRCDSRAFGLSAVRSSSGDVQASAHNSWLNYSMMRFKPKDMVPIPWMVAFALQADGWYLRQDIIWSKPNPMPESVTDRCTKAHEYVFLLSKSARYYYDAKAIAEAAVEAEKGSGNLERKYRRDFGGNPDSSSGQGFGAPWQGTARNKRSVWEIATAAYGEAHFATFPPALIEPCIKAGCPRDGTVLDPFGGAGTTGLVADRLQRNSILIELNPEYAKMAERRVFDDAPLFAEAAHGAS